MSIKFTFTYGYLYMYIIIHVCKYTVMYNTSFRYIGKKSHLFNLMAYFLSAKTLSEKTMILSLRCS